MSVPDTNTFTLQDVVDELVPFVDSLVGCFAVAVDGYFDPAYKGSKDRQSNFRNYGLGLKWIHLEPYTGKDSGHAWMQKDIINPPTGDQAAWNCVHDTYNCDAEGVVTDDNHRAKAAKRDKGGGNYDMISIRTLLSYDLRLITQTIIAVKFLCRLGSQQGISMMKISVASYSNPLIAADHDNMFPLDALMTKNNADYTQGDSSTVKFLAPFNATELSNLDSKMGNILDLGILHYKDYEDSLPQANHYVYFWKDGTEVGDYVWKPQLRLQYLGAHMLEIPWTLWEPGIPANSKDLYMIANTTNSWVTEVSVGDTWLTTIPTSGSGSKLISIRVSQNTGGYRSGTVTLDSLSGDKVLTVNQAGIPTCTASPDPLEVDGYDDNYLVTVLAYPSTNYWIASFVDTGDGIGWIHFVGDDDGTGDGDFTINIDENTSGVPRSCDIKIVSDAVSDYIVDVEQGALLIESAGGLFISNGSNSTDSVAVDVTPDAMNTSVSKKDTGDGTSWFRITSGATESGDFTLSIELYGTPPTGNKNAQVQIDDDDSGTQELVSVLYTYIT